MVTYGRGERSVEDRVSVQVGVPMAKLLATDGGARVDRG
jgi:hypothetical protein